ncbi:LSU ribosomal protein L6p (L9e) [hydrothermal vent metagenome]|uniref:LSU ribosomal protein L6p (L9e) n=1 Tax=hydrothermal vent metagenome TaxID=652676 RepID=A0A3B1CA22_9ZZZZ
MSRIGRSPIDIPQGVDVKIDGSAVTVKGKLGQLRKSFNDGMKITVEEGKVLVKRADDTRQNRSLHGLTRSLISNMVTGVSKGFFKTLLIEGVGYKVMSKGKGLEFALGYSHAITLSPPDGISFKTAKPTELTVEGVDKQLVGQVAADIRKLRKPEPYKGKGIRYSGERVRRKAGKTAVK